MAAIYVSHHPLFPDAGKRPMNLVIFGSGSGTNAQALVQAQDPTIFKVNAFFVNKQCPMKNWGEHQKIPVIFLSTDGFKDNREGYYREVIRKLEGVEFDAIVFAGWMHIVPAGFFQYASAKKIVLMNVHPADLSVVDEKNTRKYTGPSPQCVQRALQDRVVMRSSVHIMTEGVDVGPLIVLGPSVPSPAFSEEHRVTIEQATLFQNQELKPKSDWKALIRAVIVIAQGWRLDQEVIKL